MSKHIAGGNIHPSRFVSEFMLNPHTLLQCDNNMPIIGISHEEVRSNPFSRLEDKTLATKSGEEIKFYGGGVVDVLLELGGPVRLLARLKSDAEGRGIVIETGSMMAQHYGATALEDGFEGDKIRVSVTLGNCHQENTAINVNLTYTYKPIIPKEQ